MSLTMGQYRWIDCAVGLNNGDDWLTAHWVFIRKVLGEPRQNAMDMAAAFRHVPLDHQKCVKVADGWEDDS